MGKLEDLGFWIESKLFDKGMVFKISGFLIVVTLFGIKISHF